MNLTHYKLCNFFTFQSSFIPRPCWYSVAKPCPTVSDPMDCSTLSFPIHHYLLEFAQIPSFESVMLSNHLILCYPLLLLLSIFPSIRVFSSESTLRIRSPKHWSFRFSKSSLMNIQGLFPLGLTGLTPLQSNPGVQCSSSPLGTYAGVGDESL